MEPSLVSTAKRYAKFVVAAAGVVATVANVVVNGDLTSTQGLISVVVAALAAVGVRQIPNS